MDFGSVLMPFDINLKKAVKINRNMLFIEAVITKSV